eukprot:jgi/Tetstr1/430482/TSEL_020290.t1
MMAQLSWQSATLSEHLFRMGLDVPPVPTPLRVHLDYQLGNLDDPRQVAFLQDRLLPAMVAELMRHVRVRQQVGSALRLPRECASKTTLPDGSVACVELASQEYCGSPAIGIAHNLRNYFGGYRLCTPDGRDCREYSGGAGAPDADFILYTSYCDSGTIAYAAPCELDLRTSRPLAGFINFCPGSIDPSEGAFTDQLGTAVHEAIHALGFTAPLFGFFLDDDGAPRGIHNVLQEVDTTGSPEHFITTPRVVQQVRQHFNCSTLFGAKLEDEGFRGTVGSHWDSRWFQGEIMDGATDGTSSQNVFSPITMAMLEDTGWYIANWDMAGPLAFGAGEGCAFLQHCRPRPRGGGATAGSQQLADWARGGDAPGSAYWCSMGGIGDVCTWDLRGVGVCDVDDLMNECATPKQLDFDRHGPIVRTLQGQMLKKSSDDSAADCYAMRCDAGGRLFVSTAGGWRHCPSGQMLDLAGHGYLQGTLGPCPDNTVLCRQLACPSHCSGHGHCRDGTCICHLGRAGRACDQDICSPAGTALACPAGATCDPSTGQCEWPHAPAGGAVSAVPTAAPSGGRGEAEEVPPTLTATPPILTSHQPQPHAPPPPIAWRPNVTDPLAQGPPTPMPPPYALAGGAPPPSSGDAAGVSDEDAAGVDNGPSTSPGGSSPPMQNQYSASVEAVLFVWALDESGQGRMEAGAVARVRAELEQLLQPYALAVAVSVAGSNWRIVGGEAGALPAPATHRISVVVTTAIPELIAAVLSDLALAKDPMRFRDCCSLALVPPAGDGPQPPDATSATDAQPGTGGGLREVALLGGGALAPAGGADGAAPAQVLGMPMETAFVLGAAALLLAGTAILVCICVGLQIINFLGERNDQACTSSVAVPGREHGAVTKSSLTERHEDDGHALKQQAGYTMPDTDASGEMLTTTKAGGVGWSL